MMTIQMMQGFTTGASGANLGFGGTSGITETSNGRFSGGRIRIGGGNGSLNINVPTPRAKLGVHLGINTDAANSNSTLCTFSETSGGTTHLTLSISSGGFLTLTQGNGTLLGTSSYHVTTGVWFGVEVWLEVHDSTGVAKLWVNGESTPSINFSGDTKNGGSTGTIGNLSWFSSSGGNGFYICDFIIYDDQGSVNNTAPLGDIRVESTFPSGNGNSSQFVGSDSNSTDNYLLVDETPFNSDTDYVESANIGDKDTYAFANVTPTAGNVLAVQARLIAKKTDAGTREIKPVYRLSTTEVDGTVYPLNGSYEINFKDVQETKPGGGAWSITDVNNAEFGVKVTG